MTLVISISISFACWLQDMTRHVVLCFAVYVIAFLLQYVHVVHDALNQVWLLYRTCLFLNFDR